MLGLLTQPKLGTRMLPSTKVKLFRVGKIIHKMSPKRMERKVERSERRKLF